MTGSPERIRSFVAVELSEESRRLCAALQERLRRGVTGVKWVEPEQFHLTLKFLGDVPRGDVPRVSEALEAAAARLEPFTLSLRGAGAFPNQRRARVVWIGVEQGAEELRRAAAAVEEALGPLGYPPEDRPFRAHLTVGRVREPGPSPRLEESLRALSQEVCGESLIGHLTLFASKLTPKGPIYTVQTKHMYGSVL